jgi:competence protein ComEA
MKKILAVLLFSTFAALSIHASAANAGTKAAPAGTAKAAAPEKKEKLDINTATEEQLKELPGVGEARAKAIIRGRPYKSKDELAKKGILPKGVYDKIKEGIIAKQAK